MLNLSHKNPDVSQFSLNLMKDVYVITKGFPKEEQFVLTSQIRRAVISVCSNIAEVAARRSKPGKRRFFEIYRSSLVEIDTQFEIAIKLEYFKKEHLKDTESLIESIFRMLSKIINNLGGVAPAGHLPSTIYYQLCK